MLENVPEKGIEVVYVPNVMSGTLGVGLKMLVEESDVSRVPGWILEQESWMRASIRLVTCTM